MKRRDWLKGLAGSALSLPFGTAIARPRMLPALPRLGQEQALLLQPGDALYEKFEPAYNRRTMLRPALRALCKSGAAVAAMIDWARENSLPFSLRSGGHSFEGFSQSACVVIDTRLMSRVEFDEGEGIVTVGAGASIGNIYKALGVRGFTIPAGSCPTVGVSGHTLGGGYGLLSRAMGLACDSLLGVQLINAEGQLREINATSDPDLFWASRGGGGGSFGAVTCLRFAVHAIDPIGVFGLTWSVPTSLAAQLVQAWQAWAPATTSDITSFLEIAHHSPGRFRVHCAGQTLGLEEALRRELQVFTDIQRPSTLLIETMPFLRSVDHFSGGWDYELSYSKAKSSFMSSPIPSEGINTLLEHLEHASPGGPSVMCDAYGGAIAQVGTTDTAFSHRAGTLYCMQYYTDWEHADDTVRHLARIDAVYEAMQPYVSGGAYVNYCDLDLQGWQRAYWGENLERLTTIKKAVDPHNLFRHAQSVGSR